MIGRILYSPIMMAARRCILGLVASLCILVAATTHVPIRRVAQTQELRNDGYELRLKTLESVNSEHRLTVLETTLGDVTSELRWVLGALATLVIDSAVRYVKKPKTGEPSGS